MSERKSDYLITPKKNLIMDIDLMIDNAATASQNKSLVDSEGTREAILLNIIEPMKAEIDRLEAIKAKENE